MALLLTIALGIGGNAGIAFFVSGFTEVPNARSEDQKSVSILVQSILVQSILVSTITMCG